MGIEIIKGGGFGAPTEWTPTISNVGTISNANFHYAISNKVFFFHGFFTTGPSGAVASELELTLPSGVTVSSSYDQGRVTGMWFRNISTNNMYHVLAVPGDTHVGLCRHATVGGPLVAMNGNDIGTSEGQVMFGQFFID